MQQAAASGSGEGWRDGAPVTARSLRVEYPYLNRLFRWFLMSAPGRFAAGSRERGQTTGPGSLVRSGASFLTRQGKATIPTPEYSTDTAHAGALHRGMHLAHAAWNCRVNGTDQD